MRMQVQSLISLSGPGIQHCHELWCRLQTELRSCVAVAVALIQSLAWEPPYALALIQPLAWEPPYAASAALNSKKKFFSDHTNRSGLTATLRHCLAYSSPSLHTNIVKKRPWVLAYLIVSDS